MNVKKNGFTLIEILVVVAIVGILTAIALPNYLEHVKAGHRSEAKADLTELAQFMERYYTENNKYSGATTSSLPFTQSPRSGTAYYSVTLTTAADSPDTFTLTLTPTGTMDGDRCSTLALDQSGAFTKGASTQANCW